MVEEIEALGGEAVANTDDISDWAGAEKLVAQAVDTFGRLDVLVNNAGILRDRMLTNMTEAEWDAVIKVHLKGTAGPSHFAAAHWRERSKAGEAVDGRIINTSSPSGIYGNVGQTNYGAAKAGIAAFTIIASMELARYGVTVNAIAPAALTRMTENLGHGAGHRRGQGADVAQVDRADHHLAGQPRVEPGHRPRVRRERPGAVGQRGLAPGPDRRPRRSTPPSSARWSSSSWPMPVPTPTCPAATRRTEDRPCPSTPTPSARKGEPGERSWTSKDALLYALGVGAGAADPFAELEFTTENTADTPQQVLPTMAVVLGGGGGGALGQHRQRSTRPCSCTASRRSSCSPRSRSSGTVSAVGEVVGIYDKGKGAVVVTEDDRRPTSPPANRCSRRAPRCSSAARAAGAATAARPVRRTCLRTRAPDHVVTYATRTDQALLYRLSGDRNPLHSDPSFAAMGGFDRPILHGLCTYGFTGRALLHALCGGDPARFRSMEGRFSSPVMPGESLTVSMWVDGDAGLFRTTGDDGRVVLDAGRCTFG